jgi:hypothetical protein
MTADPHADDTVTYAVPPITWTQKSEGRPRAEVQAELASKVRSLAESGTCVLDLLPDSPHAQKLILVIGPDDRPCWKATHDR